MMRDPLRRNLLRKGRSCCKALQISSKKVEFACFSYTPEIP